MVGRAKDERHFRQSDLEKSDWAIVQVDYLHWNNNLARSEQGEWQVASSLTLVDVKT